MPHSISRVALWCGLLALTATAGGCQRGNKWNLAPVEGTVTKDGHPLADIQVFFLADAEAGTQGPRARGITDESGHYQLRTDNGDDGAAVGWHHVCIVDPQAKPDTPEEKRRIPSRYGRFSETPLRAQVGSEPLVFDIPIP
jgi:hypothetical protein